MKERIKIYINNLFGPYEGAKSVADLKNDLLADLNERYEELTAQGKDEQTALSQTLDTIGNMEETLREMAGLDSARNQQVLVDFSAQELKDSDFKDVTLHGGKFIGSSVRQADFTGADLTGSSFKSSDLREANFDGTNLTDCNFYALDLSGASFQESMLVRTNFRTSSLDGVNFKRILLRDVNFSMVDMRNVRFDDCVIDGGEFSSSDLRGLIFDGISVRNTVLGKAALEGASFRGATLQNVSFAPPFSISKKYYNAIKTIDFDGASMDKLTYNALKGLGANLSGVTIF